MGQEVPTPGLLRECGKGQARLPLSKNSSIVAFEPPPYTCLPTVLPPLPLSIAFTFLVKNVQRIPREPQHAPVRRDVFAAHQGLGNGVTSAAVFGFKEKTGIGTEAKKSILSGAESLAFGRHLVPTCHWGELAQTTRVSQAALGVAVDLSSPSEAQL